MRYNCQFEGKLKTLNGESLDFRIRKYDKNYLSSVTARKWLRKKTTKSNLQNTSNNQFFYDSLQVHSSKLQIISILKKFI